MPKPVHNDVENQLDVEEVSAEILQSLLTFNKENHPKILQESQDYDNKVDQIETLNEKILKQASEMKEMEAWKKTAQQEIGDLKLKSFADNGEIQDLKQRSLRDRERMTAEI